MHPPVGGGDSSIAVVADSATQPKGRFITWDYTESSPSYTIQETEQFPNLMDADYEGHRLFLYYGGSGGPGPTIKGGNLRNGIRGLHLFNLEYPVLITHPRILHGLSAASILTGITLAVLEDFPCVFYLFSFWQQSSR